MTRRIVLASASPRRADLLAMLGLPLTIAPVGVDERPLPSEDPPDLALRLARDKALAAAPATDPVLVVAADTIVVVGRQILGKPRDPAEARRFLALLSGRTHDVITGLALRACPEEDVTVETATSRVTMASLSEKDLDWYAATGEGMDKAGAYALQGKGALFITSIEGSYTNVIGLPLERLYPHLQRWHLLP
jgi:septum formation protein